MKTLLVLFLAASLAACAPLPTKDEMLAENRAQVRLIASPQGGNGSAVVIAPGLLLTAKHVSDAIEMGLDLYIEPEHIKVKVLRVSKEHDLALIEAPGVKCPCATIAKEAPKRDKEVVIIGYPLQTLVKLQILTKGHMQGLIEDRLFLTAPATFGNSGGGVFHNGKLVGIVIELVNQPIPMLFGIIGVPTNYMTRAVSTEVINHFMSNRQ